MQRPSCCCLKNYNFMRNKLKVAFICHFSDQEIRSKLSLSNFNIRNRLKRLFRKNNATIYHDFAPWVSNLIKEFEKFKDVQLHIIAPHAGLKRFTQEFELNGVFYHFFKPELPLFADRLINKLIGRKDRKYRLNRFFIARFIKNIQPDVINLIGTENPYYSISALDIKNIPVFVSAQTVYTNPKRKELSGSIDLHRWNVELKIHQKERYFGCSGRMHRDLILKNNPQAITFKHFFPIQIPYLVKEVPKEYDFIFFASQVTKKKGIEDAIEALALVKKEYSQVTLNVVGRCEENYKSSILKRIAALSLQDNVTFNDYIPVHFDMHQHIKKARFALLPVKLDVISGTIIEAMLLELPLVTYKTSGTPYLNKDGETVLLADIGDIETLAKQMLKLMNDPEYAGQLATKAKAFVEREFDNAKSAQRLLACLRAVVQHYYHNTPIPKQLLFDPKEFPIY